MSLISLPRISKLWAAAIMVALLVVGVIAVVAFPPIEDTTSTSVALLGDEPVTPQGEAGKDQAKEVVQKQSKDGSRTLESEEKELE